jgi:hypothetical protein
MPRFTTAPVEDVAPKRKQRQPSQRAQIQKQYQEALRDAMFHKQEALVVELEADDKPLTIRNRIKRAAEVLGLENVNIRRKRDRIVVYQMQSEQGEE